MQKLIERSHGSRMISLLEQVGFTKLRPPKRADEPLERQELIAMALEAIRQSRGLTRQLMTLSRGDRGMVCIERGGEETREGLFERASAGGFL